MIGSLGRSLPGALRFFPACARSFPSHNRCGAVGINQVMQKGHEAAAKGGPTMANRIARRRSGTKVGRLECSGISRAGSASFGGIMLRTGSLAGGGVARRRCASRFAQGPGARGGSCVGLFGPSAAWAQCTDTFNFRAANVPSPGQFAPQCWPRWGRARRQRIHLDDELGQYGLFDEYERLCQRARQSTARSTGWWCVGARLGGTVETKTDEPTHPLGTARGSLPLARHGTQTCHTTTRQDYVGYQVGHDISILNGGGTGANWHWGVTAGYFEAKTKDMRPGPRRPRPSWVFHARCRSWASTPPLPRATSSWTAKCADFYPNHIDGPQQRLGQQLDARGLSLTGNVGYNSPLGSAGSSSRPAASFGPV